MPDERHEKALDAAVQADGFTPNEADRKVVARAIAAYLQAMDAVICARDPEAFSVGVLGSDKYLTRSPEAWGNPKYQLAPLHRALPNHFTNGE